jgi:formamidopyrimidine-DNA glycosylase
MLLPTHRAAEGKIITGIVTRPDTIVYSGCTDEEVAKSVLGKRIKRVGRLGKYFYVSLPDARVQSVLIIYMIVRARS